MKSNNTLQKWLFKNHPSVFAQYRQETQERRRAAAYEAQRQLRIDAAKGRILAEAPQVDQDQE